MAPLRDGDRPVFMNEASPAGWCGVVCNGAAHQSAGGRRVRSFLPACLPAEAEIHVNISPWYAEDDAIVTHKPDFCGD